ncbi:MAG: DUF5684 domain-containing protein [Pseudobutyrivibrio sp.]|nr:DUF5684 domain-containing protein [Pseudobutyrivibrio sp.]
MDFMDYTSLSDSFSIMTNSIRLGISFITMILTYVGLWNMFSKAGVEGWKCIIPYYNTYVIGQISKKEKLAKILIIIQVISVVVITAFVCSAIVIGVNTVNYEDVNVFALVIMIISGIATIMLVTAEKIMEIILHYNLMKSYDAPTVFLILVIMFPYVAWLILGFSKKYLYNGGYGDFNNRTGANLYNTGNFNQQNNYNNGYYSQNQNYGQQNGYNTQNQTYGQQNGYYSQNQSYGERNGYTSYNESGSVNADSSYNNETDNSESSDDTFSL